MNPDATDHLNPLSSQDEAELTRLLQTLELSEAAMTIFAIAPEPSPEHPVVQQFQHQLPTIAESFRVETFYYSDRAFYELLYSPAKENSAAPEAGRRLVMLYGLDQLPTPRLVRELDQLNRSRETIAQRNFVLIFWLNHADFLDEFRSRAPDFWDWRGKVVTFQAHPTLNPLFFPYLEWLIAENSYLKMSGIMQVNRQVDLFLDQIYVSLQAERRQQVTETSRQGSRHQVSTPRAVRRSRIEQGDEPGLFYDEPIFDEPIAGDGVEVSTKVVTERVDLASVVQSHTYSVILGAPGAGKTTLLRYLALHYAKAKRAGLEQVVGGSQEELGTVRLPIFIRIADYAERLEDEPDLSLLQYFQQFYHQWEAAFQGSEVAAVRTTFPELLLNQMRQGRCLLLLDGLDEVFDQASRRRVVQGIDAFVEAFAGGGSGNRFMVTSRIAGYRDVQLNARFQEFTIAEMAEAQVEQFLRRWCLAIEEAQQPEAGEAQWVRQAEVEVQDILQAIGTSEGVKRLTVNPLLLTILALIHRNGPWLPDRRVELYKLAVKTLTEDWQLGKKLPDAPKRVVKEHEAMELLAPLAYWMHEEKPSGVVTQAEAVEQLAKTLGELNQVAPDSAEIQQAVDLFLRKVRETTGLFVERAPEVYSFMHLTFEEYFAARHIANNDREEILQLIRAHLHEPRWEEPILLALGYCSHTPKLIERLVEDLFCELEEYQPCLSDAAIKLKRVGSPEAALVWTAADGSVREISLGTLALAGKVLAEVDVSGGLRRRLWEKLAITYLLLDENLNDDTTKGALRLLRRIDLFSGKSEIAHYFQQVARDVSLSRKLRVRAQVAVLYICSGEAGDALRDCVTELASQFDPELFNGCRDLVTGLGEEMSAALEGICQDCGGAGEQQNVLAFFAALSYVRTKQYEKAIAQFEPLSFAVHHRLSPYRDWALAVCYQEQEKYEKANDFYQTCFEQLTLLIEPNAFLMYWRNHGVCQRLHEKWEKALDCFQQMLEIAKALKDVEEEALALYHIGRTYQEWKKYETAISFCQQSRDLYQQINKEKDVANQWFHIGDSYKDWGKYEEAIDCQKRCLELRRLEDESRVALSLYQLGRIYQAWGKYQEAIGYHQQSRDLYQKLNKETNVANQWRWMAICYREWGKYEQALAAENQDLAIRQKLDDQPNIASAYFQFGWIYQAWGKYQEAIGSYQQSRDLYQKLDKETSVANQWYWMGNCYKDWGKYEEAIDCQKRCLELRRLEDDESRVAVSLYQFGQIYQAWGKYQEAIDFYQQSRDLYQKLNKETSVANQWYRMGDCYKDWGRYEEAIDCQQRCLELRRLEDESRVALSLYQLGQIYQAWGKYQEAIDYYQQSRDLYQQLNKETSVANQWYWMGNCYKDWGRYEEAIDCQQRCLELRRLEDDSRVALSLYQLGRIYKDWGKYQEAIGYYQQSRDLYQQLNKETNVANQWYNLANCYREWGKYEQALAAEHQDLAIRQKLDEQSNIARAYFQFGWIYQAWGKYQEAIGYHQQSRDLYQQLGKETDVANLGGWLSETYRDWGKYEQAIEYRQQYLNLFQERSDQSNVAYAYYSLGRIYQAWGKYQEAIGYHQQSRDLYQKLDKETSVANQWYWMGNCYKDWGKYEEAIDCQQRCLELRRLEDDSRVALSLYQLGRIYQAWGKYQEAIGYYQQSRDLYQKLDLQQDVANQLSWLADCYRDLKDYATAIDYYQRSIERHQAIGHNESVAKKLRHLSNAQRQWAKDCPPDAATPLLQQANQNLQQALHLDTAGDYPTNLAYDQISLALLTAESLRQSEDTPTQPDPIAQFQQYYSDGLARLTDLGQIIDSAEAALNVARAYLEISPLENLDQAETLTRQSLQTFQDFNRYKLQADTYKLLGEIYLKRANQQQPDAKMTATQYLSDSLQLYRNLTLTQEIEDVQQLLSTVSISTELE